jgi:hypothetical protein
LRRAGSISARGEGHVEAGVDGVLDRPLHADVARESRHHHGTDAAFAEIAGQTGRRPLALGVPVVAEAAVAVDGGIGALAHDRVEVLQRKTGVQLCLLGALHAVVGPKDLFVSVQLDGLHGLLALVGAGEGHVTGRMPVLGSDDHAELAVAHELAEWFDDRVATLDGQASAGHEVGLHVDDQQTGLFAAHDRTPLASRRAMVAQS